MLVYQQKTGRILRRAWSQWRTPIGTLIGEAGSGCGEGYNNPALDHVKDVGPIPCGLYGIGAFFDDPGKMGPMVARLIPIGHDAKGRTGFAIHGRNANADLTDDSNGCIVADREIRNAIRNSGDNVLLVEVG